MKRVVGRVDYDRIAPTYDRRYADSRLEGVAVALGELAERVGARRVLEVGCGTGRWLAEVGPVARWRCGLDLSAGMLWQARGRDEALPLVQGRAEALPFADGCFDLVLCVNALHHFDRPRDFVAEARRLLSPGGGLAVVGMDPHAGRDRWYVYEYFEGTRETDLERFPSWGQVLDWMVAEGFGRIEWRVVERILDPKEGRAVFDDPFLRKEVSSQLTLLSDEAYEAGLRRIDAAVTAAERDGERLVFWTDITLGMLVGWAEGG